MNNSVKILLDKIDDYKTKYYKNRLIRGLLMSLTLVVSAFIAINFIEHVGRLNGILRGILLLLFVCTSIYTIFYLIIRPLLFFFRVKPRITDTEAANDIGKYFPEISDKLLNTIQLASFSEKQNSLIAASIDQKSQNLSLIPFTEAINFGENKKYLRYALPPVLLLLLISAIVPSFFQSSTRIIKFDQEFIPQAPFAFKVLNKNLQAVKNEDYTLNLRLTGEAIPETVFLNYRGRKFKMDPSEDSRNFTYTFNKVKEPINFKFTAAGFTSETYDISLLNKPELLSFDLFINYPSYLSHKPEKISNVGNVIVPEGSLLEWRFNTNFTDSLGIIFNNQPKINVEKRLIKGYNYRKTLQNSTDYKLILQNEQITNKDAITYFINVIKDQFPKIELQQIKDTTNYNFIVLGGTINDDYGFSKFLLKYKKTGDKDYIEVPVNYDPTQTSQTFFHQFDLFKLNINKEDEIQYFLEVWDNDGVNGSKSSKTALLNFKLPNSAKFNAEVDKQTQETEKSIEKLLNKSKEIKNELVKLDKSLKNKKKLDFQEKKKLQELLKKKEELKEAVQDLKNQIDKLQEKQNRFDQQSPQTKSKMDQLQKLLDELMKEDQFADEMEKLLEENQEEKVMEQLQKMKQNDRNLDKELDRTLKLFKNLQLKQKMEKSVSELQKLAEKQEKLANDQTTNKEEKTQQQEKLNKEFQEQKEELKKIEALSKELRKNLDTEKSQQNDISKEQEKASKQLKEGKDQAAKKSQKEAAKALKKLAKTLNDKMQSQEMEQLAIDLDALRNILENLIKLSFDQEELMIELKKLDKSDPRFVNASQEQLKLVDDAKVIEDSLYSLASRVMQIEAFVTKEVTKMKNSMDNSIQLLKDRNLKKANAKQQFSMTSMNNLALMLGDTFEQMQKLKSSGMPEMGGKGDGELPMPDINKRQKALNDRIKGLGSKDGVKGRELSKELAKLANEQAQLRQRLKEIQEGLNATEEGKKMGDKLKQIQKQMDQNENDLVNKRIGTQLKNRAKSIETRLLEAEKALKEQDLDTKRKSKTAVDIKRTSPPALEEFMKEKEKQLELIRTTPPNFTPYYKSETNKYFQRIK